LNTFASPWRRSCVTHSSATPPALNRVASIADRRCERTEPSHAEASTATAS
jgi:hypothetical protein